MLLPISVNLCCLDFNREMSPTYHAVLYYILAKCAVAYIWEFLLSRFRPWGELLNLLSYTSAERIAECTPMYLHYSLYSWRKSEQVFQDVFRQETFPNLFSIHATPLFWVVSTGTFVKIYQFSVIHEWLSVFFFFSKQFVSLLLDSVFFLWVAKIAINFRNKCFSSKLCISFFNLYLLGNK